MARIRLVSIVTRTNVGGPAQLISDLDAHLEPHVFEHIILAGIVSGGETEFFESRQVPDPPNVVRIPTLQRAVSPRKDTQALFRLIRLLKAIRPDIVHTHTSKAGLLGRLAAQLAAPRAKLVHTFHGDVLNGYFSGATSQLIKNAEKALARISDTLVAIDPVLRSHLIQAGIGDTSRFVVVSPGRVLPQVPSRGSARRSLGLSDDITVVTFIGRLTQIKNPQRFLDVAAAFKSIRPDVKFIMAGDGELRRELNHRITHDALPVELIGVQPNIELVLGASDFVMLTSDNEGVPISLIESALASVPMIATNVGATSSILLDGHGGFLAQPTAESLTQAHLDAIDSPTMAAKRAQLAKAHAQVAYSPAMSARQHANLYASLLGISTNS